MTWFTPTNMVPSFADAAFALKNDSDISPVIRTPYGWHIIKRLERRTTLPLEKMRTDLETKIKQNPAISKYSDDLFDRRLRATYQLKIDENNLEKLMVEASDSIKRKNWSNSINTLKGNTLFQFAGKSITIGDFATYLESQRFSVDAPHPTFALKTMLDKYINQQLIGYEDSQLENKHPDFARIIKEYHDGILLFNISKDKIWDVASTDSLRLQKFAKFLFTSLFLIKHRFYLGAHCIVFGLNDPTFVTIAVEIFFACAVVEFLQTKAVS